jgi:hypothetical protein
VNLRLGGTSADRSPRNKICGVLGSDRIKEFATGR